MRITKLTCWMLLALFASLRPSIRCEAHLGEVHPDGKHDFFPDRLPSPLSPSIYIDSVLNVIGGRDLVELPDGSNRFLVMRGANQVKITQPGQQHERNYVSFGTTDVDRTEGSVSVEVHPRFGVLGDPGYGKFYTVTIEKEPTAEPDFRSTHPEVFTHSVITEWTSTDTMATTFTGTSREIMRIEQGDIFHNVNDLAIGADGYLYIALGEDTMSRQAQDLRSIYGKILRIDPSARDSANGKYGIPADNPFVEADSLAPEVYAYGFRNIWRINFDRENGNLFAADVGLNSIEEINLVQSGSNYGWPRKEGSFLTALEALPDRPHPDTGETVAERFNLVDPLFEIDQTETNTIIGGVAYRGQRFPELHGKMIFGSWNTGTLFAGDVETGAIEILMDSEQIESAMDGKRFVSINEDLDGEIYLVGGDSIVALFRHPDFDHSGSLDVSDGNAICSAFGSDGSLFDLNGDLRVDIDDLHRFVEFAGSLPADLDLNGEVGFADFLTLAENFGQRNVLWSEGDIDCNGSVGFGDFLTLGENFGSRAAVAVVPEPAVPAVFLWAILFSVGRRVHLVQRRQA